MSFSFQMVPRYIGDALVPCYRCQVWSSETSSYELDGTHFDATCCLELSLQPERVVLIQEAHLRGEGVPRESSGRSVTPTQVLVAQDHDSFLVDPAPIAAACLPLFGAEKWPKMHDDARYILLKAQREGRWRRNLEVQISAAQVDGHLQALRETGTRLQHGAPYSSLTYWWDPDQKTFMEHRDTPHPYGGEDRQSTHAIREAQMRAVLEGIPHTLLVKKLGEGGR